MYDIEVSIEFIDMSGITYKGDLSISCMYNIYSEVTSTNRLNVILHDDSILCITDIKLTNPFGSQVDIIDRKSMSISRTTNDTHIVILYGDLVKDVRYIIELVRGYPHINFVVVSDKLYDYYKQDIDLYMLIELDDLYDNYSDIYTVEKIKDMDFEKCCSKEEDIKRVTKVFGKCPDGHDLETWYISNYIRILKKEVPLNKDVSEYISFVYYTIKDGYLFSLTDILCTSLVNCIQSSDISMYFIKLQIICHIGLHESLGSNKALVLLHDDILTLGSKNLEVIIDIDISDNKYVNSIMRLSDEMSLVPVNFLDYRFYLCYDNKDKDGRVGELLFVYDKVLECITYINIAKYERSINVKKSDMCKNVFRRTLLLK